MAARHIPQHRTLWITAGLGLAVSLLAASAALGWQITRATKMNPLEKGAAFSNVSQLNFQYERTLVWSTLMKMDGFELISGFKIDEDSREMSFAKAGDSAGAEFRNQKGRVVVTMIDDGRELRVTFEPNDAAAMISQRYVLFTAGNGCVMHCWHQFADFDEGADARAEASRESLLEGLRAFRRLVDSRIEPRGPRPHGH